MSDVSKISIDGSVYNVKDNTARENAQEAVKKCCYCTDKQ